jgi:pimeloyl-ACP methyl ester carboxylesterase
MTSFALVHGAWHGAWFWEPLAAELEQRGNAAIVVELPSADRSLGAADYAHVIVDAIAELDQPPVVVGHSFGGLTIPLVAARPVRRLIFLSALIPEPGISLIEQLEREPEIFSPGFDGAPTRDEQERSLWPDPEQAIRAFYPDCPRDVAEWAARRLRPQGRLPNIEPCPLAGWPDVPSTYVLARQDVVINPAWSRRAARERLGVDPIELEGGHSLPLSRPAELAEALTAEGT